MPRAAALAGVFQPLATPTTFEETVERLGNAIRLGILAPSERLPPERELADQLGISRSTLRQAITTLVQSGHLTSVRGRGGGTFVAAEPPLTEARAGTRLRDDWRDVLSLRAAVEIGAAALAAERADAEDVALLRACIARMDVARDFEDYRRADAGFHIAIAQAASVPRVVALMTEVQAEVSDLIAHIAHPPAVLAHANREHARLADALERHRVGDAVRLLRRHLRGTEHILGGLLP